MPLSLSAKQALIKVETVLREKNWKDFDAGELKLVLIPYYLYNYHFYTRAEKEGEVFVQSSKDGVLALNGTSLKVEEKTVKIITEIPILIAVLIALITLLEFPLVEIAIRTSPDLPNPSICLENVDS